MNQTKTPNTVEEAIAEYSKMIKPIIRRYAPMHLNDDDYYQLGLIAIWEAWMKAKENLRAYTKICIINKIRDENRKENAKKNQLPEGCTIISIEDNPEIDIADEQNSIDRYNEEVQIMEFLNKCSSSDRKLIDLKKQELRHEEIAKALGVSTKTVQRKMNDIKKMARKHFRR